MSRNRPRGPPLPRDNGLAANEETDMWNKILQDLRKAKEKNDKQKSLAEQIAALNEKMGKEAGSKFVLFSDVSTPSISSYAGKAVDRLHHTCYHGFLPVKVASGYSTSTDNGWMLTADDRGVPR